MNDNRFTACITLLQASCDAATFLGDTMKEKWEQLHIKINELTRTLSYQGIMDEYSLTLTTDRYLAMILDSHCTRCFSGKPSWEDKIGFFYMGKYANKYYQYLDDFMPSYRVEIGSNIGKAVLTVYKSKNWDPAYTGK